MRNLLDAVSQSNAFIFVMIEKASKQSGTAKALAYVGVGINLSLIILALSFIFRFYTFPGLIILTFVFLIVGRDTFLERREMWRNDKAQKQQQKAITKEIFR
jgi:hypothetical protein